MSGIRVTYSGLISLAIGIFSVITGTAFTLIVTRVLSTSDFAIWNLIGGLIIYVIIGEPIISYWATREIARGVESGKTAVISSGIFSVAGVAIYLVISYALAEKLHLDSTIFFFGGILIPVMFLNRTLTAVNLGWKPQASSYGSLFFEITKIPAALAFVYFLHMGLYGAITATVIAYIASILVLLIYARDKIKNKLRADILKKWIRLSWLSFYPGSANIIWHLDAIIFSVLTGSVVGLAYYSVSQSISNIVANSSLMSQALYPKLLGGKNRQYLQENLTRFFYFAIPLTAMSIVYAKPALFALKPVYIIGLPIAIFMTVRTFFSSIYSIYSQSLTGIETVDIDQKSTFKDFVKSKLFFLPTILIIQYIIYIVTLTVGLFLLKPLQTNNVDLVIYWSIVSLTTQIPFTVYLHILTRRQFQHKIEWPLLLRYFLSSIGAFGLAYFLMDHFLNYKNEIFVFIPNLLLFVFLGVGCYLTITYLIDKRTRELIHSIINEILKKPAS